MDNLKVGFIGYGKHAKANLYPSLKALGIKISAVATTHEESSKQAGLDYSIPNHYTDYKEMLKIEKLDCVFISAKPHQQVELVKDALIANTHVFVEKNLGSNEQEARSIEELSKKNNRIVMVGFMKRFAPIYKKLHEIVNGKDFGEIVSISQTFTSRNFTDNSKDYMLFAAIHFIDLIRYYIGEIGQVKGMETIMGDTISLSFALKAENNATASLYFSGSPSWTSSAQEIIVTGSNGYARTDGISNLKYHLNTTGSEKPGWQSIQEEEVSLKTMLTTGGGGLQNLYLNGFVDEVEYFLNAVKKGKLDINNSSENTKTMQLYDKLVESIS